MSANLTYDLSTGGRRYTFDGSSLSIYEITDGKPPTKAQSSSENTLNSSRGTFLRSLALNIINQCNLDCSYCYATGGSYDNPGAKMSLDTAQRSVDLVIDSVVKNGGNSMTIGFFGGEPMLAIDLIKKVVSYVKSTVPSGITVKYLITTNGTLITNDHIDFMKDNNFQVMLSLDGDKEVHDRNRHYPGGRGSYEETVNALEMLLGNVSVTTRITLSDTNHAIDRAVKHILSLGVSRITYALDYKIGDDAFQSFMGSLERLFVFCQESILDGNYFDITNITEPIIALALKQKKRAHCNAGVSYLSVSAEGNVYRCPRFTGNKGFRLGSVMQAENQIENAMTQFYATLKNDAGDRSLDCSNCPFVYLCGGICFHHAFSSVGSEFAVVPRECVYRCKLFELVLDLICSLTISDRRGYLTYLDRLWRNRGGDIYV